LPGRIDEFLPDLVRKLDCRDEVAYTETKAHCEIDLLVILRKGKKG
jgi:hypothetical protein